MQKVIELTDEELQIRLNFLLFLHYGSNKKKIEDWYNRPWYMLDCKDFGDRDLSPIKAIELGHIKHVHDTFKKLISD